jgi:hypothetical protein
MKRVFFLALGLFSFLMEGGCSSARYDQDRGTAQYNSRPSGYIQQNDAYPDPGEGSVLALIGAVALGVNPSYYKKSTLGGKCLVKTGDHDPLGAPCGNMVVILLDQQSGQEISRKSCSSAGEFSFVVKPDRKDLLNIASERYSLTGGAQGPFVQGQELVITLTKKAP